MPDIETQLRSYAADLLERVEPVTSAEARSMARRTQLRRRLVGVAAALVLVAGAFAAISRVGGNDPTTTAGDDVARLPMTLDGQRDWLLATLNGHNPSDDEIRSRFTDAFLAAVPPTKLRDEDRQVQKLGPWHIQSEVERRDHALAVQLVATSGQQARLTVALDAEGKIDGSTVLFTTPCATAVKPADAHLDGTLATQLQWYLAVIGGNQDPSVDEVAAHVAPNVLDQIGGASGFVAELPRVRAIGPFTPRAFEGMPTSTELNLRVGVLTGEEARVHILIEPDAPHRMLSASILTQQPCAST